MANTDVTLALDDGLFVPSVPSVPVVAGNTITIQNSEGGPAYMALSPDARSLLSVGNGSAPMIPGGQKAVFTFTKSAPGSYWVCFNQTPDTAPPAFPQVVSTDFVLAVGAGIDIVFQANAPNTGH